MHQLAANKRNTQLKICLIYIQGHLDLSNEYHCNQAYIDFIISLFLFD